MARYTPITSRTNVRPSVRVTINRQFVPGAIARQITMTEGLSANTAVISFPAVYVGANLSQLDQALVMVFVGGSGVPDFVGYLWTETQQQDARTDRVAFTARSIVARLDGVRVGQINKTAARIFPRRRGDGTELHWTLSQVLSIMFLDTELPADWRGVIGLGDLRAINASGADIDLPDLELSGSYLQVLQRILSLVPDIGIRERYSSSGKTLLDFYIIGRGHGAIRTLRCATSSQGPEQGAYVISFQKTSDTTGIYNRCIGYGRPHEHMVTVSELHPTAPLEPAWDNPAVDLYDPLTYSSDELLVMGDPERATPNSDRFDQSLGNIFRRWRLPLVVRENLILTRNALADAEGQPYPIQVFHRKHTMPNPLAIDFSFPWEATGFSTTKYELVKGWSIDEDGYLTLAAPSLERKRVNADFTRVMGFAGVAITLTLSQRRFQRRISHDTGLRPGLRFIGLTQSGFTLDFINEDLGFVQRGAVNLVDSEGEAHTFGTLHWDESTGTWVNQSAGVVQTLKNDSNLIVALTERAIAERSRKRTSVDLGNFLMLRINVGDPIRVLNRGINHLILTTYAVVHDLDTGTTVLSASDQRPVSINPSVRLSDKVKETAKKKAEMTEPPASRASLHNQIADIRDSHRLEKMMAQQDKMREARKRDAASQGLAEPMESGVAPNPFSPEHQGGTGAAEPQPRGTSTQAARAAGPTAQAAPATATPSTPAQTPDSQGEVAPQSERQPSVLDSGSQTGRYGRGEAPAPRPDRVLQPGSQRGRFGRMVDKARRDASGGDDE